MQPLVFLMVINVFVYYHQKKKVQNYSKNLEREEGEEQSGYSFPAQKRIFLLYASFLVLALLAQVSFTYSTFGL